MDPNATLDAMREIVQLYESTRSSADVGNDPDADDMSHHFQVLDQWLSGGGAFPDAWSGKG